MACKIEYKTTAAGDKVVDHVKAPNGNRSKLYDDIRSFIEDKGGEQALQEYAKVYTEEFKNWFGDSKIVDENGEPLLVFRLDRQKISVYDKGKIGENTGNYGHYGLGFSFVPFALRQQYDSLIAKTLYGPNIGAFFLKVDKSRNFNSEENLDESIRLDRDKADKVLEGYDSAVVNTDSGIITEIVVREPTQIKSLFNKGEYSTEDPNIYASEADNQHITSDQNKTIEEKDNSTFSITTNEGSADIKFNKGIDPGGEAHLTIDEITGNTEIVNATNASPILTKLYNDGFRPASNLNKEMNEAESKLWQDLTKKERAYYDKSQDRFLYRPKFRTYATKLADSKKGKWQQIYFPDSNTAKVSEVLERLQGANGNVIRKLASRLHETLASSHDIQVKVLSEKEFRKEISNRPKLASNTQAFFDPNSSKILIRENIALDPESLLLHEILHVVTAKHLKSNASSAKAFNNFFQKAKQALLDAGMGENTYELTNADEFLVAVLTEPEFMKRMKEIPPIRKNIEATNLWEELINLLRRFLGLEQGETKLLHDAMDITLKTVDAAAAAQAAEDQAFFPENEYLSDEVLYDQEQDSLLALSSIAEEDADEIEFKTEATEEQKRIIKIVEDNKERHRGAKFFTADELREKFGKGALKSMLKVKDGLWRNVFYDKKTGEEVVVQGRPSDLGQILYYEARRYDKDRLMEENNSRDSIIKRGMGTTLHWAFEQVMNELSRQNSDMGMLQPDPRMNNNYQEFFDANFDEFLQKAKKEGGDELKKIMTSLDTRGIYTHKLDKDRLIDPVDDTYEDENVVTEYTFDDKDFRNIAELVFKVYYQVFKTQADMSWDKDTIHAPRIITEAPVVGEEYAGSIDVFAVFDNGKVGHYDLKFISFADAMAREKNLSQSKIVTQKAETYTVINDEGVEETRRNKQRWGWEYLPHEVDSKFWAKKKSYDAQVAKYKDLVVDTMNIRREDVIQSRVIPVNMMFQEEGTGEIKKYTTPEGKTKSFELKRIKPRIAFLDHKDSLLKQIPLAKELTGDESLDAFINNLYNEREKLEARLERDPSNEVLRESLKALEENISAVQLDKDIGGLAERLIELNDKISDSIYQPKTLTIDTADGELKVKNPKYATFIDMNEFEDLLTLYYDLRKAARYQLDRIKATQPEKFKEIELAINKQNDMTQRLIDELQTVREQRMLDILGEAEEAIANGEEPTVDIDGYQVHLTTLKAELEAAGTGTTSRLSKYSDLSGLGSWFTELSKMNHPHLKLFKELMDNINSDVKSYVDETQKEIDKAVRDLQEWGKARGERLIDVYKYFIEDKELGANLQGHLVTKYSSDFWDARRQAIENKDMQWLKANIEMDKDRYRKAHRNQVELYSKIFKVEPTDPIVNKRMKRWEARFNMETSDFAWRNRDNWFWKIKDDAEDQWIDERWKFIQEHEPLKNFYELHQRKVKEIDAAVGGDFRIRDNFIPNVHKRTIDSMIENGVFNTKALSDVWQATLNQFRMRENDEEVGVYKNDQLVDDVPLRYFDNVPGGIANKSIDLGKSLLLFAYSAKTYQASKGIEGVSQALRRSLANTKLMKTDRLGNVIPNEYLENSEESKWVRALDQQIKYYLYGQTLQEGQEYLSDPKYAKWANQLIGLHSKIALGWNTLSLIGGHINAKAQAHQIGSEGKHFTRAQHHKAEMTFTRWDKKAGIAFEVFEVTAEGNSGTIYEKAGEVSISDVHRRYSKVFKDSPIYIWQRRSDDAIDGVVLNAMMRNYVLHPNGVDVFPKSEAHIYLKDSGYTMDDLKPMYETLELNEEVDKDENTPLNELYSFKRGDGKEEMTKTQFIKFRNKVRKVAGDIKGNYNREDISGYKTHLLGRLVMQYRGWMPAMLMKRWSNPRYDYTMEEVEIGRYRVAAGEILGQGVMPAIKNFLKVGATLGFDAVTFNKFGLSNPDMDISRKYFRKWRSQNPGDYETMLRKFSKFEDPAEEAFKEWHDERRMELQGLAAELRTYALIGGAMLAVGMLRGDDERRKDPLIRALVEHLDRVQMEIGFFMMPSEMMKIVSRSPVPVFNLLNTAYRLIGNTLGETKDIVLGAEADKSIGFIGPGEDAFELELFPEKPDRSPRFKYFFRFIPALKGINDLFEFTEHPKDRNTFWEWMFNYDNDSVYKR